MMKVLVIGATGLVGRAVATQLHKDGFHVIVMSRNAEKARGIFPEDMEVIEADVLDPSSIQYSFHGVDGLYISLPEKDLSVAIPNILEQTKSAGVKHIVYTSGSTVWEENAWHPMIKGHYEAEKAIENSGIPFTFLKLTMIMDTIPAYANNGKPFIIGKQPHSWRWIHTSDIGRMASAAFATNDARFKQLVILGTNPCTFDEAVDRYLKATGQWVKPVKSKPYWVANLLALMVGEKLKYAISIFRYFEEHPEEGDPTEAYELLGKPEMSLELFFAKEQEARK
jgi:uncharacterized protein YbjT (DUF2867 family)